MSRRSTGHEHVYRALLGFYPAEFRERFGDDLVQLFGDQLRDARAGLGPGGVFVTWLRALGDLALAAASEHLRRDRTMAHSLAPSPSIATRGLGILGVLGGLGLVAALAIDISPELNVVRLLVFNVGAIAVVVAVHRRQAAISRRLSLAATVPALLANAWYLVMVMLSIGRPQYPEPDAGFRPIFFYAAIALWLTDAVFGLVAMRIGVVSRLAGFALALGSLLAFAGIGGLGFTTGPLGAIIEPLALVGIGLVGIGWIILGIDVATRHRSLESHPRVARRSG